MLFSFFRFCADTTGSEAGAVRQQRGQDELLGAPGCILMGAVPSLLLAGDH